MQLLRDVRRWSRPAWSCACPRRWRMAGPRGRRSRRRSARRRLARSALDALLDFDVAVTLDGEQLTACRDQGVAGAVGRAGLHPGQVGRGRSRAAIAHAGAVPGRSSAAPPRRAVVRRGHAAAGRAPVSGGEATPRQRSAEWAQSIAGPWLAETLAALRRPETRAAADPGAGAHGTLRPYQQAGVAGCICCRQPRLGACLADDMGLGKTIQVISLLLVLKREQSDGEQRSRA